MYTVYGIPNCDVIKKAVTWLQDHKIGYEFHDYKKQGIDEATLQNWCKQLGYDAIFNKRSTTWKELGEAVQSTVTDERSAIRIMTEHNSIIKRPVIVKGGKVIAVGFDAKKYAELFRS